MRSCWCSSTKVGLSKDHWLESLWVVVMLISVGLLPSYWWLVCCYCWLAWAELGIRNGKDAEESKPRLEPAGNFVSAITPNFNGIEIVTAVVSHSHSKSRANPLFTSSNLGSYRGGVLGNIVCDKSSLLVIFAPFTILLIIYFFHFEDKYIT